jgi:hypothetical protein
MTYSIECLVEAEGDVTPRSVLEVKCGLNQAIRERHGTEGGTMNIKSW